MAQHLGWLGSHKADLAWRYNDGFPALTITLGDDTDIHLLAAGRDTTTILTDTGYQRVLVDLTGAELLCTVSLATPPYTRLITKTQSLTGKGGITVETDPVSGLNCVAVIHLTNNDTETALAVDSSYIITCRAKFPDGTYGTLASTNLYVIDSRSIHTEFEA